MNVGPKLAGIEMAPYPFFAVIIYAYFILTLRAVPLDAWAVLHPHIHSASPRIKLNLAHFPGITESKQGLIKFRISHWHPPPERTSRPQAYWPMRYYTTAAKLTTIYRLAHGKP